MDRSIVFALSLVCGFAASADFSISGTVLDDASKPIAGATVWLDQDRHVQKTTADAQARFHFGGVQVGPLEITAWKDGYAVGGQDAQVVGIAEVTLTLAVPDVVRLRLIESKPAAPKGGAKPPSGIEGARIKSLRINDAFHVSVEDLAAFDFPTARSDASGALVISNLPKGGHLSFLVNHRDYVEAFVPFYPVGQRDLTIQMAKGLKLQGRVADTQGKGIGGARVVVFRSGPSALREFTEAMTGPEGFYTAMLPMGVYYVWAKDATHAPPFPATVELKDSEKGGICDLAVSKAYWITGRIKGSDDRPIPAVDVEYIVKGMVFDQSLTTNDGGFRLRAGNGEGQLHIEPPAGYIASFVGDVPVVVKDGDLAVEKPIVMKALPTIDGTVQDSEGSPVPNTLVASIDPDFPVWTLTDEHGQFHVQLAKAPTEGIAHFKAEHPLRFLRSSFDVSYAKLAPVIVKLGSFEPDLSANLQDRVVNKMDAMAGRPAPELACDFWLNVSAEQQKGITLASLKGKVVVLTFWGGFDTSNAGKAKLDQLNALTTALKDAADVMIIGIHDSSGEEKDIAGYLRDDAILFPVGHDKDTQTFRAYGISGIPQTVLIDKKAILRYYDVEGRLLELIKSLRREGA